MDEKELLAGVYANVNQYGENDRRVNWIRNYAIYAKQEGISGSVAECGVFRGDLSYYINKYFSDNKFYLFDTFSGFDERDIEKELAFDKESYGKSMFADSATFSNNDSEYTRRRLPNPDVCEFKVGYFPETAKGINDRFCFVCLDMDLYEPIYAGIEFFYEKIASGGVILIHDYFHNELPGVKRAVHDYEQKHGSIPKTTIGDFLSIVLVKA